MTPDQHHLTLCRQTTSRWLKKLPALGLALSCLVASAWVQARELVSVDRPHINMRTGAGTQHNVLWSVSEGYPLEVKGRQGNWLKVRDFENDVGWVYRPLVSHNPHVIVSSRVAKIRLAPSSRGRIMGQVQHGEVMRHLARKPGWVKVQRVDGRQGWIARHLVWGW